MGGILGGGKSSGGGGVQQVVNKTEAPAYLQPFLTDLASQAQLAYQSQYSKGLQQPFAGQRTAGPTWADNAGENQAAAIARMMQGWNTPIDIGEGLNSGISQEFLKGVSDVNAVNPEFNVPTWKVINAMAGLGYDRPGMDTATTWAEIQKNPEHMARLQATLNPSAVPGASAETMQQADTLQGRIASGYFRSPEDMAFTPMSNEHLGEAIKANINPLLKHYQDTLLPQLSSAAIDKGAYGGGRAQKLNAMALDDFNSQASDIAAKMLYQNEATGQAQMFQDLQARRGARQTGMQQELTATNMVPQLRSASEQLGLDTANIYSNIGATQRAFTDAGIAAEMQKYAEMQESPFAGLGTYSGLIGSSYIPGTGATSVPSAGKFGNFASGALGGAGLMNTAQGLFPSMFQSAVGAAGPQIPGALSFAGGWPGMAASALLGGILGF